MALAIAFTTFETAIPASRQDQNKNPLDQVIAVRGGDGVELFTLFSDLLSSSRLPGGIVSMRECGSASGQLKYSFPSSTMTLREALDAVTALSKDYRWVMHDGAIDLLPASQEPALLKTSITNFELSDSHASVVSAGEKLLHTEEIRKHAASLKLSEDDLQMIIGGTSPSSIKVHMTGAMAQDVLNGIAVAQGHAVWQYSESHCGGRNTYSLTWPVL